MGAPEASTMGGQSKRGGTIEWQMTGQDAIGRIQLQIIPQFDLEQMFAGSIKDAIPKSKLSAHLMSYQSVPDHAAQFDVLKTPEELGLSPGDFIHVRDWGQGRTGERFKRVADLVAETPCPSNILELEAWRSPRVERVFSVTNLVPNQGPALFKVDVDDAFEDIQAAAQEIFQAPHRTLHMSGLVANNPDLHLPVTSWDHLFLLTVPVADADDVSGSDMPRHINGSSQDPSVTPKVDMVLTQSTPMPVCHLDFVHNIQKPMLPELDEDSTVASLRQAVEKVTGLSTDGFRIASPAHPDLSDDHKIFGQENSSRTIRNYNITSQDGIIDGSSNCMLTRVYYGSPRYISDLKSSIFNTLGIYPHLQGFGLPDDYYLLDRDRALDLTVRPQETRVLGVDTGGGIIQGIVKDESGPRIWDIGSTKILYVHLVNSYDFKTTIGLPPPSTPIFWKTYSGLSLPYHTVWGPVDLKRKGISSDGAFDKLVAWKSWRSLRTSMCRASNFHIHY
ncbi:hypothetical protein ACJZ2D_000420 [Fusarium nematophilum]